MTSCFLLRKVGSDQTYNSYVLRKYILLLLILCVILIPGCSARQEQPGEIPWKASDLRALEAPNVPDPSQDLVAAYARLTKTDLELRFDLLGSPYPYDYDLLVLLDTGPGGASQLPWGGPAGLEWDLALRFPAQGVGQAFLASGGPASVRPRILRLSVLDAAVVRLSRNELRKETSAKLEDVRFRADLLLPGSQIPADSIGPLSVGGTAPGKQSALLIAFWDTLPAATPAQALRRWSGAHTGPYGQRHGLAVLLEAAAQARLPVTLLDLKQPDRLAALESLGGLEPVRQMAKENLLILPDTAFGDPRAAPESLALSRQAGQRYGLPSSPFLYGAVEDGQLSADYRAVFANLPGSRYLRQWENRRLIPLPGSTASVGTAEETEVNEEGLSIPLREALLRGALGPETEGLFVLGGSLPGSAWGDRLVADPAFRYLAGHPWIHVLNGEDLLRFPARAGVPGCQDLLCLPEPAETAPDSPAVLAALREAPPGLFTDLAWQSYLRLTEPTADEKLQVLREGYMGQIGPLLAAARWNAAPYEQSSCAADYDWDGMPECVLASRNLFLMIDPSGGRLVLAAARERDQPYQIIGPRSQLVTGLGDRLEWRPELGILGDPQEIPGAFADAPGDWLEYQTEAAPNQILLTQPENGISKRFQLTDGGFRLELKSESSSQIRLPLLLLDSLTWRPGGYARYRLYQDPKDQSTWGLKDGIRVKVTAEGLSLIGNGFSEALPLLQKPENPNADLPPGMFLPFPMAVIDLQAPGSFAVNVVIGMPGTD